MAELPRLKILRIIARLNIGGPARHVILLDTGLQARGHKTELVHGAIGAYEASMEPLASEQGVPTIKMSCLGRSMRLLKDAHACFRLVKLMFSERPDIVHTHTSKAGMVGRTAALVFNATRPRRGRCAVIHTFHGHVFEGYFPRLVSALVRRIEQVLALSSDRIVTVSPRQRLDIVQRFRIAPDRKVATIPLGLDLQPLLQLSSAAPDLRQELKIDREGVVVGFVGRLVPIKDPETLVRAFARAREIVPNLYLVVAGDGQLRKSLEALSRELGLDRHVRFLGWTDCLACLYATVDICALSSINEGTPVALIEAMAARKAVVATEVGGVPDLIQDGVNGLLVPPRDVGRLAEAIVRLAKTPELRCRMGAAGREYAGANHSAERLVCDVERLYHTILTQKRRASWGETGSPVADIVNDHSRRRRRWRTGLADR
jgi:glycosyltransferase involved in cell wall biosynthesis